jgi:uncharacterized protein YneF (UPF0154 family)
MDITVSALPSIMSMIVSILSLVVIGAGVYLVFLVIKALRVYIKKNS